MKNNKTNLIGYAALVVLAISLLLIYFDKVTLSEMATSLMVIFTALFALGNFWSKDHNKSHSLDKDKGIGGGGIKNPPPKKND